MKEFEQLKNNFLRSLKAAEEQSGLDLSWLKVQYLQLYEAAQRGAQRTADGDKPSAPEELTEQEFQALSRWWK